MVPKIIAKGKSFKGAAAYLLHDKDGAQTSKRVEWTETRNLASSDPSLAWKIMTATALDQERLKHTAGVKSTGRRSDQSVLHMTLSWHPEDKGHLTQEDMQQAAEGALQAIGADDRQAILIAHNDEAHPHLHILCNRVSPKDGRLLASSNDRLKLSRWAEAYEKDRGKILCRDRVLNNERRREGYYVKGPRNTAKHLIAVSNDNQQTMGALFAEQRALDYALAEKGRTLHQQHKEELRSLESKHRQRVITAKHAKELEVTTAIDEIRKAFERRWQTLYHKHQFELSAFDNRESEPFGGLKNVFDLMGSHGSAQREAGQSNSKKLYSDLVSLVFSKNTRRDVLLRSQQKEKDHLIRIQQSLEKEVKRRAEDEVIPELSALRQQYQVGRTELSLRHDQDLWAFKSEWRMRGIERDRVLHSRPVADDLYSIKVADTKQQNVLRQKAEQIRRKLQKRSGWERDR